MKNYYQSYLFLTFLFLGNMLLAQTPTASTTTKNLKPKVEVTYAEFIGTTPPVRDMVSLKATDRQKRKIAKKNRKAPKDFPGRGRNTIVRPDLEHQGPDQVRQTTFNPEFNTDVEPLVNIDGLTSGFAPNDPSGDIGENHYVQAINATTIGVYDKEGNLISTFTGNSLWSSIGFASAGDPIVLYDQELKRWLITEFPNGNQLLVAVSKDSDPLGEYDVYNFSTPNFPDYPKYAIWNNAITVTTNEAGGGQLECYLIDRMSLMAGAASVPIQRIELPGNSNTEAGFFVATPVDWTGQTEPEGGPVFMALNDSSWGQSAEDQVELFTLNIDFADPNNTTFDNTSVVLSAFDGNPCSVNGPGFACVPQNGGAGLDAIPEVIMNQAHYRNFGSHESMVFNFITDATDGNNISGIRWVELRRENGMDWGLYQEGTFAPDDGKDRFMAGICMDGAGNIGLAYNVTSGDSFVGVNFTGRRSSDPLGEMTVNEFVAVEGTNSINSGGRFGDYAQMDVDPTNDRTFWYTTEYAGGGSVNTRILAFELRKDTTDIGPSAIITPQNSPDLDNAEIVSIEVTNLGLDTQQVFQVGYIFENGTPVLEPVNYVLYPDSVYAHTFTPTVDMSVVGDYDLKVFTVLADDQSPLNDTLRAIISKVPRWDAGITSIEGLGDLSCADTLVANLVLNNFGAEILTSATIEVMLNGTVYQTINWTGNLPEGMTEMIPISIVGFINGTNQISATTSLPSGMTDETPSNDSFSRDFEALIGGVAVFLNMNVDNYAGETTWELAELNGDVIFSGGPYDINNSLFTEEWCLDPEACYSFTIFDSYGDGICCGYGQGSYEITDATGAILFSSTGEFGFEETNEFCATFECTLVADINISLASVPGASDASILITQQNGTGPFQYSIDGGQTFQSSPMFSALTAGEYDVVVQDSNGCDFMETVTVLECTLAFSISVTNEMEPTGGMNGTITINVSTGNEPYSYTINGVVFQSSNVFENLTAGEYEVSVQDILGCTVTEIVTIDFETPIDDIFSDHLIEVFPNPTDGIFRINVTGLDQSSVFLKLEIYDAAGKRIQTSSITKYDDTYTGQLSLLHYPAGTYFVRFLNDDIKRMIKVVRN